MNWAGRWSNCIYCGVCLSRRGKPGARALPAQLTREHVYPANKGGWLVVAACGYCNSNRRSLPLFEWWKSPVLRQRREWAAKTGSWEPWAPASVLISLWKRGKPPRRYAPGAPRPRTG